MSYIIDRYNDDTPEVCTVTEHEDLSAISKKMEQQQNIIEEQRNLIDMLLFDRKLKVDDRRCFFCHEVGHIKRDCKKLLRQKSKKAMHVIIYSMDGSQETRWFVSILGYDVGITKVAVGLISQKLWSKFQQVRR